MSGPASRMPGYFACHKWLRLHCPKSGICDFCDRPGSTDYALKHGRTYSKNREDYHELCRRCHGQYDRGGQRSAHAKLTDDQAREIRASYTPQPPGRRSSLSQRALAERYGVSPAAIQQVVEGRKWSCL